jgi:predicted acyltransferase
MEPLEPSPSAGRLMSLDIFRGITIAAMILVNNPGNGAAYWPLKHIDWNGWTPTDLVFPFFLFIVGVALVYSFESRIAKGDGRGLLFRHVVRRAVIIFAIGLALNGFPYYHLSTLRIAGVLQRIAMCYFFAAVLTLYVGTRARIAVVALLLGSYWLLMTHVPVPGYGMPGRDVPLLDRDVNLTAYIDRLLMNGHLYEGTRDPEGLLSTMPAIATTLLGVLTGQWLRSKKERSVQCGWMLAAGIALAAGGGLWHLWFPINKKLWTSSYVLFTAGLALIGLAACYWALDVRKWRAKWTQPALVFGTNAIAAYTLSELLAICGWTFHIGTSDGSMTLQDFVYRNTFAHVSNEAFASLLYSLTFVLVCYVAIWMLYRKRIFIKI